MSFSNSSYISPMFPLGSSLVLRSPFTEATKMMKVAVLLVAVVAVAHGRSSSTMKAIFRCT